MPDAESIYQSLRESLPAIAWLPEDCWIVGGCVRDVLAGAGPKDVDCAAPDAERAAVAFAAKTGGRLVCLAKEPLATWRVVLYGLDWDFTEIDGESIDADLARRDYTIGALALSVRSPRVLLDPYDGAGDVEKRIVRMVSSANLLADPLRMLRGVRLAGRFSFELEDQTRSFITEHAHELKKSAAERVTTEMDTIVCLREVARPLAILRDLGLDRLVLAAGVDDDDIRRCAGIVLPDPVTRYAALFVGREESVDEHASAARWSRDRRRDVASLLRFVANATSSGERELPLMIHDHGVRTARRAGELLAAMGKVDLATHLTRLVRERGQALEDVRPILNGSEVREILGVDDGPAIGIVLRGLIEAQIRGSVRTKTDAVAFVRAGRTVVR